MIRMVDMKINLGYVAISLNLENSSPNKTVTLKNLEKLDENLWISKLEGLSRSNIENTIRILRYNKGYGIKVYRFTSKLIPLATHVHFENWDWKRNLGEEFKKLGEVVKETGIRVSTHPDHFTLLNSPKAEVLKASLKELDYHNSMFELMKLGSEYKIVLHVGGMYKNKEDSIKRFYEGFSMLDNSIKSRIILENDDKLYNALDVLEICKTAHIPMVLDIHHDRCNPSRYKIDELAEDIFKTWENEKFSPKIHVSSSKSDKEIRSHHDYINPEDLTAFIQSIKGLNFDFDAVIEAKMKDKALFRLMEDLKRYEYIKEVGPASIEII